MFKLCITILALLLQTCQKLSGLKQQTFYSLPGLEAQSLKSRCQRDPGLSGGWRGASFHIFCTFGDARLPGLPWLVVTSLQCVPPPSHHLLCVSPLLCVCFFKLTSYTYLFIFGHTGSSLPRSGFLYLARAGFLYLPRAGFHYLPRTGFLYLQPQAFTICRTQAFSICRTQAFSICSLKLSLFAALTLSLFAARGLLFAVCGLLLWQKMGSMSQKMGMWDLPRPGIFPVPFTGR